MINGLTLKNAFISGANNISKHKNMVNDLNIFPVPDGDTGTNMSMTMSAAANELIKTESTHAGEIAKIAASALLRGARGNSGVILSLLFRGFSKGIEGKETISGIDLANALGLGVEDAYKAVMKPTEGTILTVSRVACEKGKAAAAIEDDAVYVWSAICKGAAEALETTPELLPVLKKAGVVDAGGKGLCLRASTGTTMRQMIRSTICWAGITTIIWATGCTCTLPINIGHRSATVCYYR